MTYKKSKNLRRQFMTVVLLFALSGLFTSLTWFTSLLGEAPANISEDEGVTQDLAGKNLDQDDLGMPTDATSELVSSWWNETYAYRVRVNITEPGIRGRSDPVDVYLEFPNDHAHVNSVRVVKYEGGDSWTEINSQVWNVTNQTGDEYLAKATVTFIADTAMSETDAYFIYYADLMVENRTAYYAANSNLATLYTGSSLQIDNGQFILALDTDSGVYQLQKGALNYNTNRSLAPSASPGREISSQDLRGHWTLDGNAIDSSGSGNDGTLYGSPITTTGKIDSAIQFDGVNDYVSIPGSTEINTGGPWNSRFISLWFKADDTTGTQVIYSEGGGTRGFIIYLDGTTLYGGGWNKADYTPNWAGTWIDYPTAITAGQWYHVAIQLKDATTSIPGDAFSLYVNGELVEKGPGGTIYGHNPVYFGYSGSILGVGGVSIGTGYYFHGIVDDVRLYNRGLSDGEIRSLYELPTVDSFNLELDQTGPVFTQFTIEWDQTLDMTANDTIRVFNGLNLFQLDRTIYWGDRRTTSNNSFGAVNTLFDLTGFETTNDGFYYDTSANFRDLGDPDFTVDDYCVLRDENGGNSYTSLGLFYTGFTKGDNIDFTYLKWKTEYTGDTINFIPGNQTDLDNREARGYSGPENDPDNKLTLRFWELLTDKDSSTVYTGVGVDAGALFEVLYDALTSPVDISIGEEESRFFNLGIKVLDIDVSPVSMVNVTLYNVTNEIPDQKVGSWLTDSDGILNITRLPSNNYTMNLTYGQEAFKSFYTDALQLDMWNFTLNSTEVDFQTSKFRVFDVNMTSATLNFAQNGGEEVVGNSISGALITFYNTTGIQSSAIGVLNTSSLGRTIFHWRNYTYATNITFECEFLGAPRLINLTWSSPDNNDTIWFTNATAYSIGVAIDPFSTGLTFTDTTADPTWGNLLSYSVTYTYTIETGLPPYTPQPISGASITWEIWRGANQIATGSFGTTGGAGTATPTLNYAGSIPLEVGLSYTISVTVQRDGYTPQTRSLSIDLVGIDTTLGFDKSKYEAYWNENFTVKVQFARQSTSAPLDGATVTYKVAQVQSISGICTPTGTPGEYQFTLNTSAFEFAGSYLIEVTAALTNFKTQIQLTSVYIREIYTLINGTTFDIKDLSVYYNESKLLYFNYSQRIGDASSNIYSVVQNASIARYEWQNLDNTAEKGEGLLTFDSGSGMYILDFDSGNKPRGNYSFNVQIQEWNYMSRAMAVVLRIVPRPLTVNLTSTLDISQVDIYKAVGTPKGNKFNLTITLADPRDPGRVLSGATITLVIAGEQFKFSETATPGTYVLTFNTSGYEAFVQDNVLTGYILISAENYETIREDIRITVQMEESIVPGLPLFYFILIVGFIVVVGGSLGGYKAVQNARIPGIVKKIRATEADIRKKRDISDIEIAQTKKKYIVDEYADRWEFLGLNLGKKLGLKKPGKEKGRTEPDLEVNDKENSQAGGNV